MREQHNLRPSELARRAGVSKSLISQIESGKTNPSVETIRAIASALEVPLFSLFLEEEHPQRGVVRKGERIKITVPGSDAIRELLTPNLDGEIILVLERLGPGGMSSRRPVSHKGVESVFVLRGGVTVVLADEPYVLGPGDTFYFDARLPHLFCNETEKETEFICAASEGGFPAN